jgi:acyl-coenzyme A synthetase/AMP-(fatty) acid ligase
MLFERWREIASKFAERPALIDHAKGIAWTFRQLSDAAQTPGSHKGKIVFPHARNPEFILQVIRAWASNRVICPLEPSQLEPKIDKLVPSGVVHLKITSATTGPPQMIAFTAEQLMADCDNIVSTMGIRRDWPNIGVISLAHSYGFSNLVLPLLLHGVPLLLMESALPEAVRRVGAEFKEITLAAVPALWRAWNDANAVPKTVKLAISAGAPLPLPLEQAVFDQHELKIHNFFGSSECGGIAYDRSAVPRSDAACVGSLMDNVSVTVAGDRCLQVKSKAVGQTFWPVPRESLKDGVFQTSDMGEVRDGFVYYTGRACDRINIAGRKASPEAIERVLVTHPGVRDCLAFGVPARETGRGENIVACVVGHGGVDLESVKQYAIAQLPDWQVPRDWWIVDSLQSTQRGKLSRTEWRKKYLERMNSREKANGS